MVAKRPDDEQADVAPELTDLVADEALEERNVADDDMIALYKERESSLTPDERRDFLLLKAKVRRDRALRKRPK